MSSSNGRAMEAARNSEDSPRRSKEQGNIKDNAVSNINNETVRRLPSSSWTSWLFDHSKFIGSPSKQPTTAFEADPSVTESLSKSLHGSQSRVGLSRSHSTTSVDSTGSCESSSSSIQADTKLRQLSEDEGGDTLMWEAQVRENAQFASIPLSALLANLACLILKDGPHFA